mmetsp:Transcript_49533/g.53457  ORF Transcript_49533/g.53457 Transcript_49533/m.53457 type:complete len:84 (-) Transcript_49533:1185-1436(-)
MISHLFIVSTFIVFLRESNTNYNMLKTARFKNNKMQAQKFLSTTTKSNYLRFSATSPTSSSSLSTTLLISQLGMLEVDGVVSI